MKKFIIFLILPCSIFLFPSSASADITTGLVGYWTLNGRDTNWATGKTSDMSGQGNTGQLISMSTSTSPVAGKVGQAMNFDGINDRINISSADIVTPCTMSSWVKLSRRNTVGSPILAGSQNSFRAEQFSSDTVGITVAGFFDYVFTSPGYTVPLNTWTHLVAIVNSSSAATLYVNGIVSGTITSATGLGCYKYLIGSSVNATDFFPGLLDDVRVYNRALSASDITQLYKTGAAKVGASPTNSLTNGLVGYWPFDGKYINWATGQVADVSGSGKTGQLISMPTSTSPVVGKIGQALQFKNSTGSVVQGPSVTMTLGSFTQTAWFKTSDSGDQKIFSLGTSIHVVQILSGKLRTCWGSCNSGTGTTVSDGKWHFVAAVSTSSPNIAYYLDGKSTPEYIFLGTGSPQTNTLGIGNCVVACAYNFRGSIDEVRLYDRALSLTEITELYKQGGSKVGVSPVPASQGLGADLVGYWNFDGKNTNWATGKMTDASGQGNTGQMINMSTTTTPTVGKIGQGFKFDGVNDYVDTGGPRIPASNYTVSFWAKPNDVAAFYPTTQYTLGQAGRFVSGFELGATYVRHGGVEDYGSPVSVGVWTYMAVVRSGNNVSVYLNGVIDPLFSITNATDSTYQGANTLIGSLTTSSFFAKGLIDDVRVYNRALSASEVMQLYKLGN